jgi:hypothetical protein
VSPSPRGDGPIEAAFKESVVERVSDGGLYAWLYHQQQGDEVSAPPP